MNDIAKTADYESPSTGAFDRFLRRQLLGQLGQLRHGHLLLTDEGEQLAFGDAAADLQIHMEILDPAFYRAVATNGSVGAGEAYMDGLWRCDTPRIKSGAGSGRAGAAAGAQPRHARRHGERPGPPRWHGDARLACTAPQYA
jgi:hypothetical protein